MNTLLLKEKRNAVYEERPMPVPGVGEVVFETAYCGICRTDRKCYQQGQRDLRLPRVLGHEVSGIVVAVGDGVDDYKPGNRVMLHPGIGCGECRDCLEGNDQCCRKIRIFGFHLDGGFSRYCLIPAEGVGQGILRILPPEIDLKTAAMCEPLGCAVHMLEQTKCHQIQSLLILGGGVMGFMMALVAPCYGIKDIVVIEPNETKRELLTQGGIKAFSQREALQYTEKHYPDGIDAVIPCCPYRDAFGFGLDLVKNGGFFGFFSGLIGSDSLNSAVLNKIHYKELSIKGTYGCGSKDSEKALELLKQGLDLSVLPVNTVPLSRVESILDELETSETILSMIDFSREV